jgi:hypothetical protein
LILVKPRVPVYNDISRSQAAATFLTVKKAVFDSKVNRSTIDMTDGWIASPRLNITVALVQNASYPGFQALHKWEQRAAHQSSCISLRFTGGLGNRLTALVAAGILAFYFNKPIECHACDKRLFNLRVPGHADWGAMKFPGHRDLYTTNFTRNHSKSWTIGFFAPDHLYLHQQIGTILYKTFGQYATYFIGNYFFSIPPSIKQNIDGLMNSIPATVTTIGVHVRTHHHSSMYMRDVSSGCELVQTFIENHWSGKPYQLAVATDTQVVHDLFKAKFPNYLKSGAMPMSDGALDSAILDFCMIQSCKELVLTYRSTFSIMAAALANKTGFYYAREWSTLVRFSCSQIGMTSGVFQSTEPFNDKSNTRHRIREAHEKVMRMYYKYYLV